MQQDEADRRSHLAVNAFSRNLMLDFSKLDFRRTPVTLTLLALIAALELTSTILPERRDYFFDALRLGISPEVWAGELWRPFTTTLLHGDLLHALFNGFWLVTFGPPLEERFGPVRFGWLVVLLAYLSTMCQFVGGNWWISPDGWQPMVGFSGVIYGLFGVAWMGARREPALREVCPTSIVQFLIFWFFFAMILDYTGLMPIGNIAHGSGLVFGVLYGLAIFDRRRTLWISVALVLTFVVLATIFYCPGCELYEMQREIMERRRLLQP